MDILKNVYATTLFVIKVLILFNHWVWAIELLNLQVSFSNSSFVQYLLVQLPSPYNIGSFLLQSLLLILLIENSKNNIFMKNFISILYFIS